MTLATRALERLLDLPPAETRDVRAETVSIPAADGTTLEATRYAPEGLGDRPTVLVRSPYPRTGFGLIGRLIAERGFHVLFQSCHGTYGSDGEFVPFRRERADALATVEWLDDREWFTGELATTGPSYLGYTQWALASALRDADGVDATLVAMAPQATSAEPRSLVYPQGALGLDFLSWAATMATPEGSLWRFLARELGLGVDIDAAVDHLPLREADAAAVGEPIPFWREWLDRARDDEWCAAVDHTDAVADVDAPVHLVGGWHDVMCPQLLREYRTLVDAGNAPSLTIGPWTHDAGGLQARGLRESLQWFRAHLLGDDEPLRTEPVALYVQGADEWRTFEAWPPAGVDERRWYLRPDGDLTSEPPATAFDDRFTYDPDDPTPNVGGPIMGAGGGRTDQSTLESRPDVLTYTSEPLAEPLELIGPVTAELAVGPSPPHADVYVCLCEVDPDGVSRNVCDGLTRLRPDDERGSDGPRRATVECWPTAVRVAGGHRLRVQVAGGAFPRWSRNPGTGAPIGEATDCRPVEHEIRGGPDDRSWIRLPAIEGA